jgi:hypothetical protein
MRRSEPSARSAPALAKPVRLQAAGLYGEVSTLSLPRGAPAALKEPKTFL